MDQILADKFCLQSSTDHTCRLWQLGEGVAQCSRTLVGHHAAVWSVAHSQDGTTLASAGQEGSVRFWDVRSKDGDAAVSNTTRSPLFCVCWGLDNKQLFAGSEDGTVLEYDFRAVGEPVQRLEGHVDSVQRLAVGEIATGKAVLASAGDDCCLAVRCLSSLDKPEIVKPHNDYLRALCWKQGSIMTGSWDRTIANVGVA